MSSINTQILEKPSLITSGIKEGRDTLDITSEDLFDRIINIKFIQKAKAGQSPKTFTIRSDYEISYDRAGNITYIVCTQKPDIKLAFTHVGNTNAIEVIVEIANLHIEGTELFALNKEPITQMIIQAGYRNQFPDWTRGTWKNKPIKAFLSLAMDSVAVDLTEKSAGTRLVVQVLETTPISLPPDSITRIRGIVGSLDNGFRWVLKEGELDPALYDDAMSKKAGDVSSNFLPVIFFTLITRRYIRAGIAHQSFPPTTTEDANGVVTGSVTNISIFDPTTFELKETLKTEDNGVLSVSDAKKYGVVVTLSNMLRDLPSTEVPNAGLNGGEFTDFAPIRANLLSRQKDLVFQQLKEIAVQFDYIRYLPLSDGNFFAYHVEEEERLLFRDDYVFNKQKEKITILPAVYDISLSALKTIRCPFFTFLSPLQTVAFQSSYLLTDLVGFLTLPEKKNSFYLIIRAEISFSTVGLSPDSNMMTLHCTQIEGSASPITMPDGRLVPPEHIVSKQTRDRTKTYIEVTHKVLEGAYPLPASWLGIVCDLLMWADTSWETKPTIADAIKALKDWNQSFFSEGYIKDNPSAESETALLGYEKVSALKAGDEIKMKYPFMESYQ